MKKLIVILFVLTLLMAQCTDVNVTVVVQNDATTGDTSTVQDVGVQDTFRPKDIVVVETETDDNELTEDILIETDVNWDVNNEDVDIDIDIDIEEVSDAGVDTNIEPDYGVDYGVDEGNILDGGNDILDSSVDVPDVMDVVNYGPGYWDHRCCDERYGEVCRNKCSGNKADYENNGYFGIMIAVYDEQKDCWYYKGEDYCCKWECKDIWGLNCDAPCDIQYLCYYEHKYYGEAKCERVKSIPEACKGKIECNGGNAAYSCYYVMLEYNIWGWALKSHYCGEGKTCHFDEEGYPVCE
jgi:hypothetical protein